MSPPTIAELAMAARIFPENLQAGVAIMRGRNELEKFQHLPGCDCLPCAQRLGLRRLAR